MLASIFILQGYETYKHPERVAARAEPVVQALNQRFPALPAKAEEAVRLNGAVHMVAGALLALGRFPRLSSLALAATLVPTTWAGHQFWEAEEESTKIQQRIHFLKNASMFGGLLIAAADTAGKPSLAWRAGHAARIARREAVLTARTAKASGQAGARVGHASGKALGGARIAKSSAKAATRTAQAGARTAKVPAKRAVRTAKVLGMGSARTGKALSKGSAKVGRLRGRLAA